MPYTKKEIEFFNHLVRTYKSRKKAMEVYHAMLNSGKYDYIFSKRSLEERDRKLKKRYGKKKKQKKK